MSSRLVPLLLAASISFAVAQTVPWTTPLRGSWVQGGPAATGDVVLAGPAAMCQIVVGPQENSAVRQAAGFLAADIEKISGRKPEIVANATAGRVTVRLVTIGMGTVPATIPGSMQREWESYRILTEPGAVWLVGSNPRGTAFAAYTLSERLGIDPLYIWTGYRPEHHDPLILKQTSFSQGPPTFRYRGFFHDDEDLLPAPVRRQRQPAPDR